MCLQSPHLAVESSIMAEEVVDYRSLSDMFCFVFDNVRYGAKNT